MTVFFCQLYDQDNEVVAEAIDVLQEACEDEVTYMFIILHQQIVSIKMFRFLAVLLFLRLIIYIEHLLGC